MTDPHVGWNRLEATLITIKPGDTITVDSLVTETGLLLRRSRPCSTR